MGPFRSVAPQSSHGAPPPPRIMVSDLKKKAAERKAAKLAARGERAQKKGPEEVEEDILGNAVVKAAIDPSAINRVSTGVLTSRVTAQDIKISGFSMNISGTELVSETEIELTIGRRYGLIGANGSGKTNFLQCIANREIPIPDHMDMYHLHEEAAPSDRTALQAVVDHVVAEIAKLEARAEQIMEDFGPEDERLAMIYERLDELDPTTFEANASELLWGLGFTQVMMEKMTKDMSGGWRMRVALARALFAAPTLLLLDEPTNHLDLEACVWLEMYLAQYKKCLVLVSHSADFMNGVCTHMIWITEAKLQYYTGNYDTFCKTVEENKVIQQKAYEKEQEDIRHLKQFIASCGTYANMVKQAKSKQKILDKMYEAGLTPPLMKERSFAFEFPSSDKLAPPVLSFAEVSFSYSGKKEDHLYENVELAVDCDSRIALVGPNGAGKSTLLKLMFGDLTATEGIIQKHSHLSFGRFNQHSTEVLDNSMTVLDFFMQTYPNDPPKFVRDIEEWRGFLGRYGVSGKMQTKEIGKLSEGQKSRIVFAMICMKNPNMLLLDEPTNHLDMEGIDGLANAIKKFEGGLMLVSHDFRLIDKVADTIWVCDKKSVTTWKGTIREYKDHLRKGMKKFDASV